MFVLHSPVFSWTQSFPRYHGDDVINMGICSVDMSNSRPYGLVFPVQLQNVLEDEVLEPFCRSWCENFAS